MNAGIVLRFVLLALLNGLFTLTYAQVKSISAVKINQPVKIDGNLDDAIWQNIEPATDFITAAPNFGKISNHKTLVKIAYDNSAVYVGAYMYDNPENIRKQFTARDAIDRQDVDIFVVGFDTYQDKQNAFVFRVSAAGVQSDAKESGGGAVFDKTWDAVWQSQVSIKADGWVAEIKIPFSAIRFSKNKIQDWGLNFARFVRKENENSIWSPVNPNISGDVNQWGNWLGLKDIAPPLRLSFQPYISGGVRISPTDKGDVTEVLKSGGMDVKYGINESFTLDMTLIPDFAQVQSDNTLLNLTPFEIKFDDYRPFFTEGTELFNKAGLFYSRRIGAAPGGTSAVLKKYGNSPAYKIDKNPGITRLYNATKFSGRNKNNLGIGIFNAVSAPMYAKITNLTNGKDSSILTEPFTNYNIIVLDQALKNRSSISFTNTNVLRRGNSRNANVSSLDLSLFDKKNRYNFAIAGKYSAIWGNNGNKNGFKTITSFGKVSGLIQYNAAVNIESDTYDPNDLGFLLNNNSLKYSGNISYNLLKPAKKLLNQRYSLRFNNTYLYKPFNWTALETGASAFFLFKNFWDVTFEFQSSPLWSNDYFINSNTYNGYFLKKSPYYYLGVNGSTDSRKKLFFDLSLGGAESPLPNDPFWTSEFLVRYRFSNKFQLSGSIAIQQDKGNWGWSQIRDTNGVAVIKPIIARRNTKTNTSIVNAQYNFTNRMNLSVRMRHYWSAIENTNFYNLKNDGYWDEIPFIADKNINYNTFNIDMFYTWDFLLGSRITLAWKNALGGNANFDAYNNKTYGKNLGQSINNPHSNEVTLKIVYFLDYLNLKKKN
jgi:Domain of unknown function (DUF5916)/Carbohydrate family 9 binding domain-like